ncbi:MAG: CHAT domain-containing protein, partial [Chloroflexi bacterium]|nr:CHAT domain-containing protein [Chloroflexota bacterium]
EVYGLDLHNTDLVVLSACETQLGRQSQGDDIIALNRAFMYAGTPTVVASLWSVNDEATSQLMRSFYQHLKEGMGKAEALRAAQAELRTRYPHPFYWAAFVLTGDPGAPLSTAPAVPAWAIVAVAIILLISAALLFIRWRSRSTSVQSVPQIR